MKNKPLFFSHFSKTFLLFISLNFLKLSSTQKTPSSTTDEFQCKVTTSIENEVMTTFADCSNLNTPYLPSNIPMHASGIKISYNNLQEFCGLPVEDGGRLIPEDENTTDDENPEGIDYSDFLGSAYDDPSSLTNTSDFTSEIESSLSNLFDSDTTETPPEISEGRDTYPVLTTLDISYNPLKEICDYSFAMMPELKFLTLTNTHIETMTNKTFYGLANIEEIELNYNQLKTVERSTFSNMPKLHTLLAFKNQIISLPDYLFLNDTQLQKIVLAQNQIHNFTKHTFAGLENLVELDLSENRITFRSISCGFFVNVRDYDKACRVPYLFH